MSTEKNLVFNCSLPLFQAVQAVLHLLPNILWGQVGQTWQNWGFLPGLMDDIIPFRENNSVFPSLWISFLFSITMLFTYINTYSCTFSLKHTCLGNQYMSCFNLTLPLSLYHCQHLPVGTTAPTVTPNLFCYSSSLPPSPKNQNVPMLLHAAARICAAPHKTISRNWCRLKLSKQKSSEHLSSAVLHYAIFKYLY